MSLAMLYMYLAAVPAAVDSGGSMAMGAASGATTDFVLLPLAFIVSLFASAIWELDRIGHLSPSRAAQNADGTGVCFGGGRIADRSGEHEATANGAGTSSARPWLAPRLEGACHIAMCVTMGYMLILML